MITKEQIDQYLPTIGIECHVQLKTVTKLFSAVDNDAIDAKPNTLVSPICFGMPGVLPYLNEEAVRLSIKAGLALNAEINLYSKFDRKHYFYPDLPKGYQITQFSEPIVGNGSIEIDVDGELRKIGVTRAHLEEDAGKSTHPEGKDYSLVDLNRAGTPLLEVVSDPDMHSPAEAKAFARELYLLMKFADVSYVNLFHGNMRFDVNVSVAKKESKTLGTRSETKNLNSFKSVEKAAQFEINRQIELLEKGQTVKQETRGWDDAKQKTFSQRGKEEAHDYRYFPDPDLPPIQLDKEDVEKAKNEMPLMPKQIRLKLESFNVSKAQIETLLDNSLLLSILLEVLESGTEKQVKNTVNWLTGDLLNTTSSDNFDEQSFKLKSNDCIELSTLVEEDKLNSTAAKQVLTVLVKSDDKPEVVAKELNLIQNSNTGEIELIVDNVISENHVAAEQLKNGEFKVLGFLVGQVMKQSKGTANPKLAQAAIKKKLGI